MSAVNGDRSRFHRLRKHRTKMRLALRALRAERLAAAATVAAGAPKKL